VPRKPATQVSPYGVAARDSALLTSTAIPQRRDDPERHGDRGSGDDPPNGRRRFVRYWQLEPEYGIGWSRMHIDRLIAAGKFPAKVRFSRNTVGWFSDQIEAWMAERVASPAPPLPNDLPKARAAWAEQRPRRAKKPGSEQGAQ
jgi:prophage regulatory protein